MHLEILVEEESAEAALAILVPRVLPGVSFAIHPHRGKPALLKALPGRMLGYSKWAERNEARIVVLVDRDAQDCHELKQKLEEAARQAGLVTKSAAPAGAPFTVVNRLAIEELEASWAMSRPWAPPSRAYRRASAPGGRSGSRTPWPAAPGRRCTASSGAPDTIPAARSKSRVGWPPTWTRRATHRPASGSSATPSGSPPCPDHGRGLAPVCPGLPGRPSGPPGGLGAWSAERPGPPRDAALRRRRPACPQGPRHHGARGQQPSLAMQHPCSRNAAARPQSGSAGAPGAGSRLAARAAARPAGQPGPPGPGRPAHAAWATEPSPSAA